MKKNALWALALLATWAQAQPYAGWDRFRTLTINTSASGGANVAGTVTNFPLLVRLTNASAATGANLLTEAMAGGADVRFTDSTGMNPLSYQIESWTSTSAAIWVKVPAVAGNASTRIRMYWGKSGSTSLSSAAAVFDTADGYTGVWHLNEAGGSAVTVADATVNGLNYAGEAGVLSVPGVSGGSRYYNPGQAGGDAYSVDEAPSNTKYLAAGANTRITVSAWVNRRGAGSSASQGVFSNFRYGAGNHRSYALMRNAAGNFNVLTSVDGAADSRRVSTTTTFPDNQWQHVVATINPAGGSAPVIRIWVNGVSQSLTGTNTAAAAAAVFPATSADAKPLIGALERSYQQLCETFIDELQLANGTIRDSNWIRLAYETQRPDSAKVEMGAVQSVAARALFYPLKNASYMLNTAIAPNEPVTSGAATAWGITPGTLPAGLSFSASTGTITGTPTAASAAAQYVVNATVGGNVVRDTLTIAVTTGTPPNAPTGVTAARGNRQATVSWTAPLVTGSAALTSYKAMAVADTSRNCVTPNGAALSCTITGLTNGQAYTFIVRAISSAGASASSAASTAVTPASVPGAPTGLAITPLSGTGTTGTATLTWTAPASDSGSAIIEYYTQSTPAGAFCYIALPSPLTCTVTGMVYGTAYSISVYAINGVGPGPNSAPVMMTSTGILPGSPVIRVSRASRPFTFVLQPEALAAEKVTISLSDLHGRTIWSESLVPAASHLKEITWNGKSSQGLPVSAGMYLVQVSLESAGKTRESALRAVSIRPR